MHNSRQKQWQDHYTRKAKKEGFPARSVYKLKEIQNKYGLIKKGDKVLDLGCSPGSWLAYCSKIVGPTGHVTGIDIKPLEIPQPDNSSVYTVDIFELTEDIGKGFNLILSDMAPSTTGNKHVDSVRSFNLCQAALDIAANRLAENGSFVCKIFQGSDFKEFVDYTKRIFKKVSIFKPQSSRKQSKEIFITAKGLIDI